MTPSLVKIANLNSTAIGAINNNWDKIDAEFDKVFYKNGSVNMDGPIDMDNHQIYNLRDAVLEHEAVNYGQLLSAQIAAGGGGGDAQLRADLLNPDKGSNIVAYATGQTLKQKLDSLVTGGGSDLVDFVSQRQTNETDQACFDRLCAAGIRRFYFKGGQGRTAGKYKIGCEPWTNGDIQNPQSPNYVPGDVTALLIEGPGNILSGMVIKGDGKRKTTFLQGDSNYGFMGCARGGPNITDVVFEDVCFEGNNPAYTISSQSFHNVALFGCSDVTFNRCLFKNSPGDGLDASRGAKQGSPNHNENVTVQYCEFDGGTGPNRNPFTHEDCVGWTIVHNYVHDFTTNGEPGSFDTEPVITDGTITPGTVVGNNIARVGRVNYSYNRFKKCQGVTFALQYDVRLTLDYGGMFTVHGNIVEDCFSFIDIVGPPDDQPDITRSFACQVTGNIVRRLTGPLGRIGGGLGVNIEGNEFEDADLLRFGYGWGNRFVTVRRNKFIRCGRTNGFPFIANLDCRYISIEDNDFIACGRTDGLGANAILLTTDGANEYGTPANAIVPRIMGISLDRNRVYNTKSNGDAGVLTHFAINNATGGYGPGASKSGNEFYGTALPNSDTFNPPAVPIGAVVTQTLNGITVASGGSNNFDFNVAGLSPSKRFRMYFDVFPGPGPALVIGQPVPISSTVVRVIVDNRGGGIWNIPNGTKAVLEEI